MSGLLAGVCDALYAQPARSAGRGRVLMLIGAQPQLGVTAAARAVAEGLGPGAVYAIDLDLRRNALAQSFAKDSPLGPRIDGALNGARFHGAIDAKGAAAPAPPFGFHRVGRTRLYVGAVDARALPAGGRLVLSAGGAYWDAVRAGGAMAVVDAPALARSKAALAVARRMDGVVIVVGAGEGAAPAAIETKGALVKAGANVMGLIYAGASAEVLALDRLTRQAV